MPPPPQSEPDEYEGTWFSLNPKDNPSIYLIQGLSFLALGSLVGFRAYRRIGPYNKLAVRIIGLGISGACYGFGSCSLYTWKTGKELPHLLTYFGIEAPIKVIPKPKGDI